MKAKKGAKSRTRSRKETRENKIANMIKTMTPEYIIDNKDTLDFHELCKIYPFSEGLAFTLRYKIDWNTLYIYNQTIDKMFFYNNEGFLNWERISAHKNLPSIALKRCPDRLDWSQVCRNSQMSEDLMEILYEYLDYEAICEYQNLSVRFIEDHLNDLKLYMTTICDNQVLSQDFMREYKDIVDWSAISRSQRLSESFMEEMKDYIDWTWASYKQKMSAHFIETHLDDINLYCLMKKDAYIPKAVQRTPLYEICKLYMTKGYDIFDVEDITTKELEAG